MSEASFKSRMRKKVIERGVYAEAGYTPYSTGKPDHYYEGHRGVLWVEYKWIPRKNPCTFDEDKVLEESQKRWIRRARNNGVRVWTAVGRGGKVVDVYWFGNYSREYVYHRLTEDGLADAISFQTGRSR